MLERGIGTDLSDVRVHVDDRADRVTRAVGATAFTSGRDIFFRAGAFDPDSRTGLFLLAHEAAHVAQQSAYGDHAGHGFDGDIRLAATLAAAGDPRRGGPGRRTRRDGAAERAPP